MPLGICGKLHPPCTCEGGQGKGKLPAGCWAWGVAGGGPPGKWFGCRQCIPPAQWPRSNYGRPQRGPKCLEHLQGAIKNCFPKLRPKHRSGNKCIRPMSEHTRFSGKICYREPCCNHILIQMHLCNVNALLTEIKTTDKQEPAVVQLSG